MNVVQKALRDLIHIDGPQSLARLMQLGLAFPSHGYYQRMPAIGKSGDFVTSPEISQLFGEMMAVKIAQWHALSGSSQPIEIIELGPGKGTLLADILRAIKQFKTATASISGCSLVEISARLRQRQKAALAPFASVSKSWFESVDHINIDSYTGKSIVVIAHEFFDALPRHVFKKAESGKWREVLVGIDSQDRFCLTPSSSPTKIQVALEHDERLFKSNNEAVEISPESTRIAEWIRALLLKHRPGLGIITDYGSLSPPGFSLRAIRDHKILQSITEDIGSCDISGDVDFGNLRNVFRNSMKTEIFYQGEFLQMMGIGHRTKDLISQHQERPNIADSFAEEYKRLVDPKEMGSVYKILTVESQ